ncbi:RNA polymerase sigma factor [Roseivirga pacifica]|uniref:RNA polymerase sigma factor n=1 Tax=Roseivirga pacifica TaxID=1267423 RepID=UPI002094C618|nr:RNA polymerase sigma factor [Roseivirga pacifica]MCO6360714.1 sigma-70 family RNA polymerase sigma factor [Roseivirga pacifica]MCO6368603.1 sigma-70 family RNA polymerase sigma factor [Roseivirga pacifica]MCO6372746.1 sigma-70 family RNA polymerase sigma factor [Roseivirga pacifica]MCO6376804.1 sigma-70 family RNA polymerase sigma factor [Roseivirga pacifica]MCO6377917.1 sigma-70 family RNA polymerase sigma factor [Roseivirga pacifica]
MIEDIELIQKCIKGNLKAQRELYDRYAAKLMPMAMRYAKSQEDAEDILQDALIKIFNSLESFRKEAQFLTWMKRIVINTAINHNRKKLYQQPMLDIEKTPLHVEKELVISQLHFSELMAMFQKLPVGCRTVFNLYAIEGYAHKEIAEMLEISEGTSKSQFARARTLLKQMIEEAERVITSNVSMS